MVEYLSYFTGPVIVVLGMWQFYYTGTMYPALWMMYALLPMLDYFSTLDLRNRTASEYEELEKDWRYLVPLYIIWALDFILLFWALNTVYY